MKPTQQSLSAAQGLAPRAKSQERLGESATVFGQLALADALRVKSAEYWLKLGKPVEALMDLGNLTESAAHHSWPLKVHLSAILAVRQ